MNRWVRLLKKWVWWTFPCIAIATQPTPCWRRRRRHKFFQRGFKENSSSSGDYLQLHVWPIAQTPWQKNFPFVICNYPHPAVHSILPLVWKEESCTKSPESSTLSSWEKTWSEKWKMDQTCSENLESMLQDGIIDHKRLWAWQPISLDNGNWKYSTNTKHLLVIKPV